MSVVIRKISYSKWWKNPSVAWLPDGDLQADALKDIQTYRSALSVYKPSTNVPSDRVIAALAANRDTLSVIDWALLDVGQLKSKGYSLQNSPDEGNTLDSDVNKVHFNIIKLSPITLYELACTISTIVASRRRTYGKDDVARVINDSIDACYIDKTCLSEKLRAKLQTYRESVS